DTADLILYSYIRCQNKLGPRIITNDWFCSKCYMLMRKYKQQTDSEVVSQTIASADDEEISNIHSLCSFPEIRFQRDHDTQSRLAVLLTKIHLDLSHEALCGIFEYESKASVSKCIGSMCEVLKKDFIPKYLGAKNLSRSQLLSHTPKQCRLLYDIPDDKALIIIDGTCLYTQKSTNYRIQKRFYSVQKGRNLVKPMMIVAPDGFIIEANGPFVGANNDASITQFMLNIEADLFKLLIPGDFILVDRGFRDVVDPLKSKGYNVLMPHYLKQASQYTTEQANESRLVTKFRWTVEAKNGHLKTKYKIFNNCISVKLLPLIPDLFRIACALEN
ncbi:Vacuolar protein sorting-associated protein 13C-like protein, partial [Dinothrombium tinctorium]